MFKPGQKVKIIGAFSNVGKTEEYVMLDPFEKGDVENTERYINKDTLKLNCDSHKHEVSEEEFMRLDGEFEVIRSNDVFTKIKIGEHVISIPNHKILEVE